jgi:hypothetical protein
MSTLICQVQSRLPVAVVAMFGTLDTTSAARMMVALRDVVADAPIALIVDAAHLVVASEKALHAFGDLVRQSRLWPGTGVTLAGAAPETARMIRSVTDDVELFDSLAPATAAAITLPVPPRRSIVLQPDANAPAESRRFVQTVCAEWGIRRLANLTELISSELVTNAVMHARTPMNVTLRLLDDRLSVDVRDSDPRPMFRPSPDAPGAPGDEHGRGLLLLDAMATAWGSSPTGNGKVVWANIKL